MMSLMVEDKFVGVVYIPPNLRHIINPPLPTIIIDSGGFSVGYRVIVRGSPFVRQLNALAQ